MLPRPLTQILANQAGVLSRRQIAAAGCDDNDIERWVRRRELARLHRGVYVEHTGPPSREQLHWAAVLACWPAALYGRSALEAFGLRCGGRLPTDPAEPLVHVAVEHPRKVRVPTGVRVRRVPGLSDQVQWNLGPPRQRVEHAVLAACAAEPTRSAAFALAADAVQQRRTTAARLAAALAGCPRMTHGAWLRRALPDVEAGAHSILEQSYVHRVERAHRLPPGRRQRRGAGSHTPAYRDVEYPDHGVVVELDGRVGHEWTQDRWRDMARDPDSGAEGLLTLRLGWPHVAEAPCDTAARIARALSRRGWSGRVRRCGPGCAAA